MSSSFWRNLNSVRKTCAQNIKSVVVIGGVDVGGHIGCFCIAAVGRTDSKTVWFCWLIIPLLSTSKCVVSRLNKIHQCTSNVNPFTPSSTLGLGLGCYSNPCNCSVPQFVCLYLQVALRFCPNFPGSSRVHKDSFRCKKWGKLWVGRQRLAILSYFYLIAAAGQVSGSVQWSQGGVGTDGHTVRAAA